LGLTEHRESLGPKGTLSTWGIRALVFFRNGKEDPEKARSHLADDPMSCPKSSGRTIAQRGLFAGHGKQRRGGNKEGAIASHARQRKPENRGSTAFLRTRGGIRITGVPSGADSNGQNRETKKEEKRGEGGKRKKVIRSYSAESTQKSRESLQIESNAAIRQKTNESRE